MSKKAKQYSATEKTKIVIEAIKSEMTIAQISSKYGVHSTQISAWKKRGIESLVNGFQIKASTRDPDNQDLIKQLYEQIGRRSYHPTECLKDHKLGISVSNIAALSIYLKPFLNREVNDLWSFF